MSASPICPLASRHSLGIGRRSFFRVASTYVSPQESLILAYVVFFFRYTLRMVCTHRLPAAVSHAVYCTAAHKKKKKNY